MNSLHKHLLPALVLTLWSSLLFGWAETDDDDLVIDAPWRTIRNYVPVLFFAPELEGYSVIQMLSIYNWDVQTGTKKDLIFRDINPAKVGGTKKNPVRLQDNSISQQYPFRMICQDLSIKIIDPHGRARGRLGLQEKFESFWHYIVRVPTACIGNGSARGKRGVHYIRAEFQADQMEEISRPKIVTKVLRVVIDDRQLPKFEPVDRHYDVHIHTIAEQTQREVTSVDAARKVFGGPIAMVLDSAYALGLVNTKFDNANWSDFRDIIATTDHNGFFSAGQFDDGSKPGYGPTADLANGASAEFAWYRQNFGTLGAEEVSVAGKSDASGFRGGSHYLLYGAPHIEGPWHGGSLHRTVTDPIDFLNLEEIDLFNLTIGVRVGAKSDATLDHVHTKAAVTNGFGYAAHPYSEWFGWLDRLIYDAIGFNASVTRLNKDGTDFIFKGLQLWNGISDYVTKRNFKSTICDETPGCFIDNSFLVEGFPYSVHDNLNPFMTRDDRQAVYQEQAQNGCIKDLSGVSSDQKFINFRADCYPRNNIPDHLQELESALTKYYNLVAPLLSFSFQSGSQPKEHFIRKLYIAAATDAHGDFNYKTGSMAAVFAEMEIEGFDELKGKLEDVPGIDKLDGTIINMSNISSNAFGRVRTYTLTSERVLPLVTSGPQASNLGATSRGFSRARLDKPQLKTSVLKSKPLQPSGTSLSVPTSPTESDRPLTQSANSPISNADPSRLASVEAYRDGNTILTDNPICKFSIDANCRLDSGNSPNAWHDRQCVYENADGKIGGEGKFDGGRTALIVRDQADAWINTIWDDLPSYHPNQPVPNSINYDLVHIRSGAQAKTYTNVVSGSRGRAKHAPLGINLADTGKLAASSNLPQAVLLKGQTASGNCVTNPVWVAPVEFAIKHPPAGCPIATNELEVTLIFPLSMDSTTTSGGSSPTAPDTSGPKVHTHDEEPVLLGEFGPAYRGIRVFALPLDSEGISSGDAIELKGEREWLGHYKEVSANSGFTIKNSRYIIRNDKPIPCANEDWDTRRHASVRGSVSYAIVASDVRDLHGNELNDIGKTITIARNAASTDIRDLINPKDTKTPPAKETDDAGRRDPRLPKKRPPQ